MISCLLSIYWLNLRKYETGSEPVDNTKIRGVVIVESL